MFPTRVGRPRTVGVWVRRLLFGATAAIVLAVGAGGAQAVGGSLDPSFGTGGKVLTSVGRDTFAMPEDVGIQKDGKIVVAGWREDWDDDFVLVRYTRGGVLDPGFGRGGKVLTGSGRGVDDRAYAVAVQKDGKIVVVGWSDKHGDDFALARYTSAGELDASFGRGGKVLSDLRNGRPDSAYAVAVQKDGKIVVAGETGEYNKRGSGAFALARYTSAGRLDAGFGRGGKVFTDFGRGNDDVAWAVAVQQDGKIVAAGEYGETGRRDFALARYTSAGKLDAGFGRGGKVLTDFGRGSDDRAWAVAVQKDGKIVAAGEDGGDFALVRYTVTGRLDVGFGRGGRVLTDFGGFDDAFAAMIESGGKIVVAGLSDVMGHQDFALARYTASGRPDAGFGKSGKVLTNLGKESEMANAVAVQADGKIVASGYSGGYFALARYTK